MKNESAKNPQNKQTNKPKLMKIFLKHAKKFETSGF